MIVIPPAKGKTRIAIGIALGLVRRKEFKKVVLVYQNKLLRQQDEPHWEKIRQFISGYEATITTLTGYDQLALNSNSNSVVIVDEADVNFIDEVREPPRQYRALICLTATIPQTEEGYELNRLKSLQFQMNEGFGYTPFSPPAPEKIETIENFFTQKNERNACLVFADESNLERVKREAQKHYSEVKVNCEDMDQIRAMDGCCLVVTDESLMRGVDYRLKEQGTSSKTDGIDLLITGSF